jgi:hypothetical protein
MINISQTIRSALRLFAAAAILGGCGESTQSLNPAGQTPLGIARALNQHALPRVDSEGIEPGAKGLERLHARELIIRCKNYNGGSNPTVCNFHTTVPGTAKGPYPGTFTASGGWTSGEHIGHSFIESFTISSGSSQVTGSISFHTFSGQGGPVGTYQYVSSVGNGTAQVEVIRRKDFRETFSGM